jgi:RHS repeat-associated protein
MVDDAPGVDRDLAQVWVVDNSGRRSRQAHLRALLPGLEVCGSGYSAKSNSNYKRDYDPSVGRYIESDPIGLDAGINTYAYVGDDPANSYDPSGLAPPGRTAPSPLPPGPLDFPANPQPWSGDVAIAIQNAIENIVNAIVDSRTIPKPAKPTCGCTCTCRADANDNIPGNIQPGDKTFAFGTANAPNCSEASKQAKRIATRALGKQPKHVGCRCTES